jgi:hypothetical protein
MEQPRHDRVDQRIDENQKEDKDKNTISIKERFKGVKASWQESDEHPVAIKRRDRKKIKYR